MGIPQHERIRETLAKIGFNETDSRTTRYFGCLLCDPVIAARKDEVLRKRPGYPNDCSIWGGKPESVEYIVAHMTPEERGELHYRISHWSINKETGLTEPPKES